MIRSLPALASALFALTLAAAAQTPSSTWTPPAGHPTLLLWPSGAPGPGLSTGPEHAVPGKDVAGRPVLRITDISVPALTLFAAPGAADPAPAIVVFPGGSYQHLAIDLEGTEVCDWLNAIQVDCVLLKYRVPNSGPYPKSSAALQDAQRALGLVRQHAAAWHIDPDRLGVLGFSAGGHLAAALSTHNASRLYPVIDAADSLSCRPDFAIIIYPGWLALSEKNYEPNPDLPVTAAVPPTYLVQAEDDPVHVENAIAWFMALKRAGVPAELHLYSRGGHGYGLRPTNLPITHWPNLATIWLHTIGILPAPPN